LKKMAAKFVSFKSINYLCTEILKPKPN